MKASTEGLRARGKALESRAGRWIPLLGAHRTPAAGARVSAPAYTASTAATVCGFALGVSAIVAAWSDPVEAGVLLICAIAVFLAGWIGRQRSAFPATIRAGLLISTVLSTWLVMIGISTLVYLVAGATTSLDKAIFESFAGFTTTAHTAFEPVERLGPGVKFWRASTQWIGGFSALLTMVVVLPFLGVGAPRPGDLAKSTRTSQVMTARTRRTVRRMLAVYIGLTATGATLFFVGGMGLFDALTYALTTISTGGMANHRGSFGYFDSAVLEWIAIGGMFLAGANFVVLWTAIRGQFQRLRSSVELRVYTGMILVGSAIIAVRLDGPVDATSYRHALFSMVSAASTTGFTVTDWDFWEPGAQAVLLVAIGVGSMSGSTGGGFRIIRLMVVAEAIRRELGRQLRPRQVESLRTGNVVVDPRVASRMIGHMVLYILGVALGASALALTGVDVLAALTGAVSALSTVGPGFHDLGPAHDAGEVSGVTRGVLAFLMLSGRLAFYPVVGGLTVVGSQVATRLADARASLIWRDT